jgi:hypothetical protein
MYAILVKNNEQSYDVLSSLSYTDQEIMNNIENAINNESPVIGMAASDHKFTATYGAVWNGTSFSGGKASKMSDATEEEVNSFDLYVFLQNNVLIARYGVRTDSPKSEMFKAAFESDVILVKVPEDQTVYAGETHNWDGSRFL